MTVKDRILVSMHNHHKVGDLDRMTKHILSSEVHAPIRSLNRSVAQCINEGFISYKNKQFSISSIERIEKHLEDF